MNILVTGAAGFIGSNITDAYIEQGHSVIAIDNLSSSDLKFINQESKFYQRNLVTDEITDIFEKNKIDVINHHASQIDLRRSINDPLFDAENNIIASLKLFECAKKFNVNKIIFASSGGAIYDDKYLPSVESQNVTPLTPYGISKYTIEKYLVFYKKYFGINYIIFRYSNVFGERQGLSKESGVISIFCKRLMENKNPIIFGDGKNTRDFVYVKDVVSANLNAIEYNGTGLFNISSNKEVSVNELLHTIKNNFPDDINALYKDPVPNEQIRSRLCNDKAKKDFGWKPGFDFDAAIANTCKWFKEYYGRK